ncbi:hypothetical protein DRW03_14155 [Corallococcus sp. H22C18031201]|nr:hypothetical protein DRW03_14155 [Corallococcus sp. H22C18031201]
MNSITSLGGPRVQAATTNAGGSVGGTSGARFGALVQGPNAQAPRPGDPLSGSSVVASALSQVGASPHGALLGSYMMNAVKGGGGQGGKAGAGPSADDTKALNDLAIMSSVSMSQAILGMGNDMKIDLERE